MSNELELVGDLTDEMGQLIGKFLEKDLPVFAVIAIIEYHKFNLLKAIQPKVQQKPESNLVVANNIS